MQHEFTKRLEILIKQEGLTKRQLALTLGYENPEKIYRLWRENNARPGFDILEDIARKFDKYSLEWLITGNGEMMKSKDAKSSQAVAAPDLREAIESIEAGIEKLKQLSK